MNRRESRKTGVFDFEPTCIHSSLHSFTKSEVGSELDMPRLYPSSMRIYAMPWANTAILHNGFTKRCLMAGRRNELKACSFSGSFNQGFSCLISPVLSSLLWLR
ncbi:hypothetical protein AMATHDRAFT_61516 [Amanita thiersii Skay4041]|uniref:Uncharacterized protein n=1 Tax=Amanita thiersii Skay4041 TaxID=703135 RepID=A0A2A9NHV7_9AGAR|nr:hypothetical protein AMATHDRAFT_61516 [Amanita thiersii Skay4041]